MTATRETLAAARVENALATALGALTAATDLYHALGGQLPDDFPPIDEELGCLHRRLDRLVKTTQ